MYDHQSFSPAAKGSRHVNLLTPFTSYAAFGDTSRSLVFIMSITRWLPGLLTWIYDHSSHPGILKLRQNKAETRTVAKGLLDIKRQELKDGAPRKDIMSLLGLWLPFFPFCCVAVERFSLVKASVSQHQDRRMTDEEIISQVR